MNFARSVILPLNLACESRSVRDCVESAFEQYRSSLMNHLTALGLSEDCSGDIVQETFLAYYSDLSRGVSIQVPRAWLYTVSSRLALKRFQELRTEAITGARDLVALYDRYRSEQPSAETCLVAEQRNRALLAAVQSLSAQQRICLYLRAEGLRYREIAEILEVKVSTVAEFLRRAIERLRTVLDD